MDSSEDDYCSRPRVRNGFIGHYIPIPLNSSNYFNCCWTHTVFQNEDPSFHYSCAEKNIWGCLNMMESFAGICLNLMVMLPLLSNVSLRKEYMTPSIFSISTSDFFFSLITIPKLCITLFIGDVPYLTGCQLPALIGYGLWLTTGLNLLGMATLRFFAVYFPLTTKSRKFKYACTLTPVFGWLLSFIILLPTLVGRYGQFGLECKSFRCQFISINEHGEPLGFGPDKLFGFLIVFSGCLMVSFNIATLRVVTKKSGKLFKQLGNSDSRCSGKCSKNDKIIKRIIAIVTASYVLVYLPVMILHSIVPNAMITHRWLTMICQFLACSLVVIDPLTFIVCHKKLRKEIHFFAKKSNTDVTKFIYRLLFIAGVNKNSNCKDKNVSLDEQTKTESIKT